VHDAVVIGAGISGLAAAHRLTAEGKDVVVLEAAETACSASPNPAVGGVGTMVKPEPFHRSTQVWKSESLWLLERYE